jgi:uncharacterized protein YjdB
LVLVPAIPAAAVVSDLPAPTEVTIGGQACGPEPILVTLDRAVGGRMSVTATFDPAVTQAKVGAVDTAGDPHGSQSLPVVDGVLSASVSASLLTDNDVNTLVVSAQNADRTQTGPAVECAFLLHRAPSFWPFVLPVIGAEAVYPGQRIPRGGVGVPGAFVVPAPVDADAASFEYGFTTDYYAQPTAWTAVPATANAVIPFVPTSTGVQFLKVVEVDETGLRSSTATRSINVAEPGAAQAAPRVVTVTEPSDGTADDGMIPLGLTLTSDMTASGGPKGWGGSTLYHGTTELVHTAFDAETKTVQVDESQLGTGFKNLRIEYVQFPGAPVVTESARICAASCAYSGGTAKVVSLSWSDDRSHPSYNTHYEAQASGFAPAPLSYTYQWLRDGAAISGATSKSYLSSPADVGRQVSVRITARGPRMNPKSVTSTPFTVRDRGEMGVSFGVKGVGTRWNENFCYCTADNGDVVGQIDGPAVEALIAFPSSTSYTTGVTPQTSGEGNDTGVALWFEMEGYVQGRGWEGLKRKGYNYYVGSVGENRRLEAFRITPAGPHASFYDVWYRTYVPKYGWLGWAKDGANTGTRGFGYPIERVQIRVLPTGKQLESASGNAAYYDAPVQKQVHVSSYLRPSNTWRAPVIGGSTAGLTSTNQRMNALRVDVDGTQYSGGVQVAARVEGDGWRSYVSNDRVAGTYHATNRTSAYRMRLTDQMAAQYDIYYRTHVAGTGWLGWARNSGRAGTESYATRITAVQVLLVKKGDPAPPNAYGRAAYLD